MKTQLRSAGLCLLLLGSAQAGALEISSTDATVPVDLTLDIISQPLTVDLFDPSLGILTGVTVTLEYDMNTVGTVTNTAAQPQTFQFNAAGNGFVVGTPDTPSSLIVDNLFAVLTAPTLTFANVAPNDPQSYGPFDLAESASQSSGFDLTEFIGPGTFSVDVSLFAGQTFFGGGGNTVAGLTTVGNASLTVTYEFDPLQISVPSTLLLTLVGLIGIQGARRWRD